MKQQRFWGVRETLQGAGRLEDPPEELMPRGAGLQMFIPRGVTASLGLAELTNYHFPPVDGTERSQRAW